MPDLLGRLTRALAGRYAIEREIGSRWQIVAAQDHVPPSGRR